MRKYLFYSLLIILTMQSLKSNASGYAAGAEMTYVWLHDSTYEIFYHFYRDCRGVAEPDSINVCYRNSCGITGDTLILIKSIYIPPGIDNSGVSLSCPGRPNQCISDTSTIPGVRDWWYKAAVTLTKCNYWTFSHAEANRKASANLSATDTVLYIEAILDNLDAPNNSSVYFTTKTQYYTCDSVPTAFNLGAYDINNDSLSFECITPLVGSNCSANNATYASGYYLPDNPIDCDNSFIFNSSTGQMFFTPYATGLYVLAVRVSEYRNISSTWVKVGSVIRDFSFNVMPCTTPAPTTTLITSSITGASFSTGTIYSCNNTSFSFSYDCKINKTGRRLTIKDNHQAFSGPPTVTYTNMYTDSVHGIFSWTSGVKDTGLKIFAVAVTDSSCSDGFLISSTYAIPIYLRPVTNILSDIPGVCPGGTANLSAIGGSGFTWGVLPGGSPLSSLSCSSCVNPAASPSVTTSYTVSSTNPFCYNLDTFKLVVDTFPVKPVASNSSPLCPGKYLSLYASYPSIPNNYFHWTGPAGYISNLQTPFRYTPVIAGVYKVFVTDAYNCASPIDSTIVTISSPPPKPTILSDSVFCSGYPMNLLAYSLDSLGHGDTVSHFFWTDPSGFVTTSPANVSYNYLIQSPPIAGVYKVWASSLLYFCHSDTTSVRVSLKPTPSKPIAGSNSPLCVGQTLYLTASDTGGGITYHWAIPDTSIHYTIANPIITTPDKGIYKVWVTNSFNCPSFADSIDVIVDSIVTPAVSISMQLIPPFTCKVTANTTYGGTSPTFQWRKNGVDISGATTNPYSINFLKSGDVISVLVHSSTHCAIPDTATAITLPLFVETTTNYNSFSIYPNPITGNQLFIELDKPLSAEVSIVIHDVYGRVLLSKRLNPNTFSSKIIPVDVSALSPGIYILTIADAVNGYENYRMKFIKE